MFERHDQKLADFVFYGRFHELLPIVLGFHRDFHGPKRNDTCLRFMSKNSSFSRFMDVFMSYCPHFWGSSATYTTRNTRYTFKSYEQNLVVFTFYSRFHELLPI